MTYKGLTHIFIRSAYNYSMDQETKISGLSCPEPTLTDQSFIEECDINTIVENFGLTGMLPQNLQVPTSGDFSDALDYQQSLNLLIMANRAFMELPANVRSRFGNDAQEFVRFASDPENLDACRELGLAPPKKVPSAPLDVRVVADPTQLIEAVRGTSPLVGATSVSKTTAPPSKD